jgi:peroxiredoxin
LRHSGILDQAIKSGARMPDFVLQTPQGEKVSSEDLLEQGPLVMHFFRGAW